MWLTHFLNRAVVERRAQMAGEIGWILVVRIDLIADLASQCEYRRIVDARFRELAEACLAIEETHRHAVRCTEFGGVSGRRPMLDGEFFPKTMHRAFADLAHDVANLFRLHAALGEGDGAIDIRLGHRAARVGLERDR